MYLVCAHGSFIFTDHFHTQLALMGVRPLRPDQNQEVGNIMFWKFFASSQRASSFFLKRRFSVLMRTPCLY